MLLIAEGGGTQKDFPMLPAWMGEGKSKNGEKGQMERVKGFEPSTYTLARYRSTPELHPRFHWNGSGFIPICTGNARGKLGVK
jgi:hypothetical protein